MSRGGLDPRPGQAAGWASSALILGAVLAAAAVRVWGLGFGLPYRYHIDEQGWVAYGGRLCTGQFDFPAWTAGPNLMHIVICGGDVALFAGGWIGGRWGSVADFRAAYESDPTSVYLTGRSISVLLGTLTPLLVYLLGVKLWGPRTGLVAATLMAFTFLHVRDSHYVVSDILVTLLLTACLFFCAKSLQSGSLRDIVWAGLFAGLAAGVKFTLAMAALPVAAAYLFWRTGGEADRRVAARQWIRHLAVIGAAFFVGFLVGYPNLIKALLDLPTFSRDLVSEWRAAQTRGQLWQIDPMPGWVFYGKSLGWGMGWPVAALALGGAGLAVWRRSRGDALLLSFLLPFLFFLGGRQYVTAHYMIPALPILVLFAARALVAAASRTMAGSVWILVVAVPVLLFPSLRSIVQYDSLLLERDTRTLAKEWFETHIEEDAKVAISLYVFWEPPLSTHQNPQPNSERRYDVETVGGLGGVTDVEFEAIQEQGFEYLVISSYVNEIPLRDPARQAARDAFFGKLERLARLVYVVKPFSGEEEPPFRYDQVYGPWTSLDMFERPGPVIEVYELSRPPTGKNPSMAFHSPAEWVSGADAWLARAD